MPVKCLFKLKLTKTFELHWNKSNFSRLNIREVHSFTEKKTVSILNSLDLLSSSNCFFFVLSVFFGLAMAVWQVTAVLLCVVAEVSEWTRCRTRSAWHLHHKSCGQTHARARSALYSTRHARELHINTVSVVPQRLQSIGYKVEFFFPQTW